MAPNLRLMEHLTWPEYEQRIKAGRPILLACGATEQHGPHLPLGTDYMQAQGVALAIAERVDGIVAPPLVYGYKSQPFSGGGQAFVGTTSLDGETLTYLVRDILREFIRHGARRIVLIDGHYENASFLTEGIDLALRDKPSSDVKILLIHWWELISQETLDRAFDGKFPGYAREHAAVLETSAISYLHPELVRWDRLVDDEAQRIPQYAIYPPPADAVPASGVLSPARKASREIGGTIIQEVVEAASRAIRFEFGL
ncbi:MAG: creatininase [Bacillota bacterium]